MSINSTTVRKLFAYAYCAAVGSFVFGLFLVRSATIAAVPMLANLYHVETINRPPQQRRCLKSTPIKRWRGADAGQLASPTILIPSQR
jgi:hypothetical protein